MTSASHALRSRVKAIVPVAATGVRAFHGWVARRRASRKYVTEHLPCFAEYGFDEIYLSNSGNHPLAHIRRTERCIAIENASVLCLGCRDGRESARWLARGARRVLGIDFFPQPAWRALQGADLSRRSVFAAGDARRLPVADASFDLVSSESLLEHVSRPQLSIDEMFRVTKPGGVVFAIFGPLFFTAGGAHFEGTYEHLLMERDEFLTFIARRGREIERNECLFYFQHDMFSYWSLDQYLEGFAKFERLHAALFVSPEALAIRDSDPELWRRLQTKRPEKDLLASGLALWLRRPS